MLRLMEMIGGISKIWEKLKNMEKDYVHAWFRKSLQVVRVLLTLWKNWERLNPSSTQLPLKRVIESAKIQNDLLAILSATKLVTPFITIMFLLHGAIDQ